MLLITYKALNNLAPPYPSDLLPRHAPTRCLRSAGANTQDHQDQAPDLGWHGLFSCCTLPLERHPHPPGSHPTIVQTSPLQIRLHLLTPVPFLSLSSIPWLVPHCFSRFFLIFFTKMFCLLFLCFVLPYIQSLWVLRKALYKSKGSLLCYIYIYLLSFEKYACIYEMYEY